MIVTGKTQVEYKNNLQEDLTRLSDPELTLKEAKCDFCLTEVQYLGYQVSSCGLELLAQRIQPVMDALASTGIRCWPKLCWPDTVKSEELSPYYH